MPPSTGKLVTQSELFTDECVAPLKILQSLLSLEAKLWRVQRHFKGKTIAEETTETQWDADHGM